MDRPALKRLLADIEAGTVNCVVVYKVDRLSRSLLDFARIMEIFDRHGATFVSVTQQFNTTSSMGRLTLNILLSFAQFEREMISERTRDKMAAARKKGKWVGGNVVMGYDLAPQGGALLLNSREADQVRQIFQLYIEQGALMPVIEELERRGWRTKSRVTRELRQMGGKPFNKTTLHNLLTNVIYTGRVCYKGTLCGGEHDRIIDDETWNAVQEQLNRNGRRGGRNTPNKYGALLKGLVRCGSCGVGMTHTYVQKNATTLYRYYVCTNAHQRGWNKCRTRSVPAATLENAVIQNIRGISRSPLMLSEVLRQLEGQSPERVTAFNAANVRQALEEFDPLWDQLTNFERGKFIGLLVREVQYDGTTGDVTLAFHTPALKQYCDGVPPGNETIQYEQQHCS